MQPSSAAFFVAVLVLLTAPAATIGYSADPELKDKQWMRGFDDCETSSEPTIDIYWQSPTSVILRQSKCLSYEAPFIYLLIGEELALLFDTGATESASEFPLYKTVRSLVADKKLLVVHSHGHRDHRSADSQFQGVPGVTLVDVDKTSVVDALSISQWPEGHGSIDLGGRELIVIPSPGHQEEALSIYDPQTGWLLTGDTVYPGLIYVKHWDEYRKSIARLSEFAGRHEVSAVLGAHIEATNRRGEYYAVGTIFQPDEAPLPLGTDVLATLNAELQQRPRPNQIELGQLRIIPMNLLQRKLSDFGRWISE